jgi:hypothetical protein
MQLRIARHTERLEEVVAFYRDGIGLPEIGSFRDHAGYHGVFLAVPGTAAHLEFTAEGSHGAPATHPETLLVLYAGDAQAVDAVMQRRPPVRSTAATRSSPARSRSHERDGHAGRSEPRKAARNRARPSPR